MLAQVITVVLLFLYVRIIARLGPGREEGDQAASFDRALSGGKELSLQS